MTPFRPPLPPGAEFIEGCMQLGIAGFGLGGAEGKWMDGQPVRALKPPPA